MIFRNLVAGDPNKESNKNAIIKISRHRNLACLVTFIIISIICIICGVIIGFFLRVRNFNTVDIINPNNTDSDRTIELVSELISLDPVASAMVMNWYIIGDTCFAPDGTIPDDIPNPMPDSCVPVNITFDTNLLRLNGDDWDKKLDNDAPSVPIFTWDPQGFYGQFSKQAIFRTTSALFSKSKLISNSGSGPQDASLQNYPFDSYEALVYAYGIDGNNNTVNLQRVYSTGIAVGFTAVSEINPDGTDGTIEDMITFSRNTLVKAYVFIIVIGVWIITLIFVGSVCKVLFGYQQPMEAFVIPIGTLFAITSLRGSMPGAPNGFGAIIDFVGILPCLAIITITGVFLFAFLVIAKNIEGVINETAAEYRAQEKLTPTSSI
ncbi:hypothetical protein BDQ17DRAFT_1432269 [Cyathus striatus]|nr:hypothetical protein BDQ17DRAFT_1432269 [Cyathus striatus]